MTKSSSRPPADSTLGAAFSGPALWISLALVVATAVAYSAVAGHGFTNFDDPGYVTDNPEVKRGLGAGTIAWAFTTGHMYNWHPLTWISHLADVSLYGVNPGAHHVTSLLFHLVNTVLLFGLLRRLTGATGRSAAVAGLFALHPLHVESVAWVSERKDVLSTFFLLLTIGAYAGYARDPRPARYAAVCALLALGLMSKPMLVTLPFALLLLDYWPLGRVAGGPPPAVRGARVSARPWARLALEKLPLLALVVVSSVVTYLAQQRGGSVGGWETFPLSLTAGNAAISYFAYLGKMVWPAGLAAFYPYPRSLDVSLVIAAVVGLVALTAAAFAVATRRPYVPVGWLWYLGTLVPVIGLVQVGTQAMADRYTYVPLIGVFVVLAWGLTDVLARWSGRDRVLAAGAIALLIACAFLTFRQVAHWKSSESLWRRALRVTRGNHVAHTNLGSVLEKDGRGDEAAAHFAEAVRLQPRFSLALYGLAMAQVRQGRSDDAIQNFRAALRSDPGYAEAHSSLGAALATQGKTAEGIEHFEEAIRLRPAFVGARVNLAIALATAGRTAEANAQLAEALRLEPGNALALQVREALNRAPASSPAR